jgi:hypothetical protein
MACVTGGVARAASGGMTTAAVNRTQARWRQQRIWGRISYSAEKPTSQKRDGGTPSELQAFGLLAHGASLRMTAWGGDAVLVVQGLHQLVERPVQVLVGALFFVDLADGVHHGGMVLAAELAADFR